MFCQCTCMRMRTRSHLARYHIRLLLVFAETTLHKLGSELVAIEFLAKRLLWIELSFPDRKYGRRFARHGEFGHSCRPQLRLHVQDPDRRQLGGRQDGISRSILRWLVLSFIRLDSRHWFQSQDAFQVRQALFNTTLSGIYTARACVYEYIVAVFFTTESIHPWILPWSSQLHYTVFSSFHIDLGIRWSGWLLASIYTPFIGDCLPQSLFSPAYLQALGWVYMTCPVLLANLSFHSPYTVYIAKCKKNVTKLTCYRFPLLPLPWSGHCSLLVRKC